VLEFGSHFHGPNVCPAGLSYCEDFITAEEEVELLETIDGKGSAWKRHIRRAQQFFGLVYYQTSHKVPQLQPTGADLMEAQRGRPLDEMPEWLLQRVLQLGVFQGDSLNQVLANEYLENAGIGLHVEDPAAGDVVVTLSLISPVQFTLQRAVDGKPQHKTVRNKEDCVKILLEPRSLLILSGESRHGYAHCIRQSRLVPLRDGEVLRRSDDYRRVSLTFRSIVEEKRTANRQDAPEGFVAYKVRHKQSEVTSGCRS